MVIALLRVRLHLPMCHSLKEKRSIMKKVINKLRTNHNCAVAETDLQDVWQSAEISIVTVYAEKGPAESLLDKLEKLLETEEEIQVAARQIEFL